MPGRTITRRGRSHGPTGRLAPGAVIVLLGAAWLWFAGGPAAATPPTLVTGKGVGFRPIGDPRAPVVKPPDDPLFKYQWNLAAIGLPGAWAVSRGAGATVAVLDTGVAYENRGRYRRAPDLAGTRFVAGWDFVANDAHPDDRPAPGARPSHGTLIAGIIAQSTDNGIGSAGVAPAAAIMPIRVLRPNLTGSARTIAEGLRFAADHGADVANLSLAGVSGARVLKDAIDYAFSKGVTIVAAAGNDGAASVSFPAAYPNVIAVGATGQDRARASYSNYGRALDLVAPAGAGEAVDAGYGPGDGVVAQTLKGSLSDFCECFTASTSAAAAEVSGVAALLVGSRRAATPAAVRQALLSGARDLGAPGWDPEFGAGLVQAWGALAAARALPAKLSGRALPAASGRSSSAASRQSSSAASRQSSSGVTTLVLAGAGLASLAALSFGRRRRRKRVNAD